MRKSKSPTRISLLLFFALPSFAQQAATPPACGKPPAILQSTQPNIFSEQQEQWLGEAMADQIDSEYRPVKNPEQNAYLQTIGARLLAALPPTKIQFHFTLVESSDINGFSLAGGRVYLTRKLVASAHNEDEIAGVIAHEMGHILSHQFAIETTADLKRLLGITSVTDRADIYAKFERLTDARMHDKHPGPSGDTDEKQDEADRVAVYAAAAAGYRPQAYAEFWDRSFFVGGKTGSRFSDFFGQTTPSQKRLRKIRGIIAELPATCAGQTENASAAFQAWHNLVLQNQAAKPGASEAAAGTTIKLDPPLRFDIEHIRFSRDGKYLLAQDESSIFVLSRDPFKLLFRFDADRALPADFSPDSQFIFFHTVGLHVEQWSIPLQKFVVAHEVVSSETCLQTMLSPDGQTIFCVSADDGMFNLSLIDVDTQKVLFFKKGWFQPNYLFAFMFAISHEREDSDFGITYSFSQDGNTIIIGPNHYKFAFDLKTRTQIKLGSQLGGDYVSASYAFAGNNQVLGVNAENSKDSGYFSFPDGKRIKQLQFSFASMKATTGGKYMLVPGPPDFPAGVADVDTARYVYATRTPAIDVIDQTVVSENTDGSLLMAKLGSKDPKDLSKATLSQSPIASTSTIALSPDGRYLALSGHTRGTVWDLTTGKQVMLVRGYRYAGWTSDTTLLGEVPELDKDHPRAMAEMTMNPAHAHKLTYKFPDDAHLENGHLLAWKADSNKKGWTFDAYSPVDASVAWTRHFDEGHPGYTTNSGDSDLIFSYPIQYSLAKERLKNDATLKEQANAIKQKAAGRLIEIVNSADGTTRAQVVVEVPLTYDSVDGFNRVGDLLYLSVGDNRTIVYSMKTGAQLRQLFGYVSSVDQASQMVCIANRRDEVIVLDKTGAELQHFSLGTPLRFTRLRANGTELIVLTADQTVHRFPIAAKAIEPATAMKGSN